MVKVYCLYEKIDPSEGIGDFFRISQDLEESGLPWIIREDSDGKIYFLMTLLDYTKFLEAEFPRDTGLFGVSFYKTDPVTKDITVGKYSTLSHSWDLELGVLGSVSLIYKDPELIVGDILFCSIDLYGNKRAEVLKNNFGIEIL